MRTWLTAILLLTPLIAGSASIRTGDMSTPRMTHTATLLADGRVLITGGYGYPSFCGNLCVDFPVHRSAELFDPQSGRFSSTGDMLSPRAGHTATLLKSGKVLIANGVPDDGVGNTGTFPITVAELYEPTTGTFAATGSMHVPRYVPSALALMDGRVLMIGGEATDNTPALTPEIYDPTTGTFSLTAKPRSQRVDPTAVVLHDGRVLVAGGKAGSYASESMRTAELFDPSANTFAPTGDMAVARFGASAALLSDGRVLLMGGNHGAAPNAEIYDPLSGTFAPAIDLPVGKLLSLPNGTVLIVISGVMDIYDPVRESLYSVGSLIDPAAGPTVTLLDDGRVLFAGGSRGELPYHTPAVTAGSEVFSFTNYRRRSVTH
jgi:hypothetical protein